MSESEAQGTLSLLKGSCKPQGRPILSCCIHPQQLRVGMHPGPHPSWGCCGAPPGAAVLGMDAEAPGIFQHAHGVPHYPPKWLPAHLNWLWLLHRDLLCHMGCRGLGNHPVDPAHHPAGCGQCRGVSSWQEASSRGAHCPGNTTCTSCSRCLQSSPKRSLVSLRFHVLLGKHGTAAQPDQTPLNSSSLTVVVSKLHSLFEAYS